LSYVIEDNIPLPPILNRGKRTAGPRTPLTIKLWALMPGQSFLLQLDDYRKATSYFTRMPDRKFVTRKEDRIGWRVWRLE
jgi:hypothetical protein